jgi:hypothetical protein
LSKTKKGYNSWIKMARESRKLNTIYSQASSESEGTGTKFRDIRVPSFSHDLSLMNTDFQEQGCSVRTHSLLGSGRPPLVVTRRVIFGHDDRQDG